MEWADGRRRCRWANPKNQRYLDYHDHEWGVPVREDGKLFELLLLECFQAGLSWECVLNKREAFRRASLPHAPAEPLDWMETTCPARWRTDEGEIEYDWDDDFGAEPLKR